MLATAKSYSPWPPALSMSPSPKVVEDSSENKINPMFASASSSEPSPTYSSEKQNFNSFVFDDEDLYLFMGLSCCRFSIEKMLHRSCILDNIQIH